MAKFIMFWDSNDMETIVNLDKVAFARLTTEEDPNESYVSVYFAKEQQVTVRHGDESARVWGDLTNHVAIKDRPFAK